MLQSPDIRVYVVRLPHLTLPCNVLSSTRDNPRDFYLLCTCLACVFLTRKDMDMSKPSYALQPLEQFTRVNAGISRGTTYLEAQHPLED